MRLILLMLMPLYQYQYEEAGGSSPLTPTNFLIHYRNTYGSSSDNFVISYALAKLSIGNGPLPTQVTADHSGQLVFPV